VKIVCRTSSDGYEISHSTGRAALDRSRPTISFRLHIRVTQQSEP
jgi:hypothetical protein